MSVPHRYHLLDCLGHGGFGVVYRARLEGPEGFTKDVALKLLRDEDAPDRVIARFRDEARILGRLRDRAIVGVDPPVRLDGRWALVMEFVDGVSGAWLAEQGPVPPRVALEIAGEVARALDAAWHQPGPDGQPLHLLHRDLKPANLQITPTGQVKLLDLGIARADLPDREARTTRRISGSPGYIAPERLAGTEAPAGDVYSLGVVLHELIVGVRPSDGAAPPTFEEAASEPPPEHAALDLARAMRAPSPADRPSAAEVERRCLELAITLDGPTLRQWAPDHVPPLPPTLDDPRVGTVLTAETTTGPQPPAPPTGSLWTLPAAIVGAVLLALLGWNLRPPPPPPLAEALAQPFADFVIEPDAAASERTGLRERDQWDPVLYDAVVGAVEAGAKPEVFQRLDQQWKVYRDVVAAIREAGLPEVVAGIPWLESGYRPEMQSSVCAKGLWQLMPESAVRARELHGVDLEIRDCRLEDGTLFTPTGLAPPTDHEPYAPGGRCRIPARNGCAVDERTDVGKSTAAVLALLAPTWSDPEIRDSGAVVQATVASHFFGYDDSAWGEPRPTNLLPAFEAWAADTAPAEHPRFLGAPDTDLDPATVRLAGGAIGVHFLAVCVYAQNYPEEPVFREWAKYREGYCRSLEIPTRSELALQGSAADP